MRERTVALVAGASRGCGRGIAAVLGEAGATVYVTGRSVRGGPAPVDGAGGTIDNTADEVTRRGGVGIPVRIDHTDETQTAALFEQIRSEQGRLDLMVSAVWGGNERFTDPVWKQSFWEYPPSFWNDCMEAGPQAFWLAARGAAGVMAGQESGLIIAVSEPVLQADKLSGNMQFDVFEHLPHYCLNRLVHSMAAPCRSVQVTVLGLLPGFMKTERVQVHMQDPALQKLYRYDLAETPEYTGRAVAALLRDEKVLSKAGELLFVGDLAMEYGFTDVDGRQVPNFYRATGRM